MPGYDCGLRGINSRVLYWVPLSRNALDAIACLTPSMLSALRRVMRPLVRLMLRKGVTYTMFTDLLKEVFVDVAHREFRLNDTAPTDSRISLLTGVHRKDVRRLRNEGDTAIAALPDNITLGAQLVNVWTNTPPFCSAPGQARGACAASQCGWRLLIRRPGRQGQHRYPRPGGAGRMVAPGRRAAR